jgi:hypothetical protein
MDGLLALIVIWILVGKFHHWIDKMEETHRESTKYEVPDVIPDPKLKKYKFYA